MQALSWQTFDNSTTVRPRLKFLSSLWPWNSERYSSKSVSDLMGKTYVVYQFTVRLTEAHSIEAEGSRLGPVCLGFEIGIFHNFGTSGYLSIYLSLFLVSFLVSFLPSFLSSFLPSFLPFFWLREFASKYPLS